MRRWKDWLGGLSFFSLWLILAFGFLAYNGRERVEADPHDQVAAEIESYRRSTVQEILNLRADVLRLERKVDAAIDVLDTAGFRVSMPPQEAPAAHPTAPE